MRLRQLTVSEAVRDGVEFTRAAWWRAGAIQLVAAIGVALMFISLRAPLMPATAVQVWEMGLVVSLVAWAPLWAVLHRLAIGGAAAERVWPGGLQFGPTELRFLALGWASLFAVVLTILPLIAVSAAIFVLFHGFGRVHLGPLGGIEISFLIAAGVWLAGLAGLGYAAARLAYAPAATVARRKLVVADTWSLTRGQAWTIAGAWLLAQAPVLLGMALLAVVDGMELQDKAGFSSRWPMPDAIIAGAVLGFVSAFVHAPLTTGVLSALYRRQRAERARIGAQTPPPRYVVDARRPGPAAREPLTI